MIKKASRAGLIKKRLTRCVKNKRVWPHWGFLRKISPYCSVSTQHGPFRPCCFWEKKVIDKFQENVRTEGPKFVEFFCQDRRVQKYTEKNKEMDRKGLKSDDGPFRTTSRDGLYQVHLFQTGATDAVEMLTLILSLSIYFFFRILCLVKHEFNFMIPNNSKIMVSVKQFISLNNLLVPRSFSYTRSFSSHKCK